MKSYKIYKYTNLITGMSYIGQTCLSRKEREGKNMSGYKQCIEFYKAIQAYGIESFSYELLWDELTLQEANDYEQIEIENHNSLYPDGYNMQTGGYNFLHTDASRTKMSQNHADVSGKNNPMYGRKGKDSPNYGKKFTDEHRSKISKALTGKKKSAKHCSNISKVKTGKKKPQITGENNPMNNPENARKVSEALRKYHLERKGQLVLFDN